jgi:hypothetical protein
MASKPCIICGEDCDTQIKLPHGSFYVHRYTCTKTINYAINESVPILWMGKEDLSNHDHYTKEELKNFTAEEMIEAVDNVADDLWDDYFSESFDNLTEATAKQLELNKVYATPEEDLPLLIGKLKYKESEKVLTQRMKECTSNEQ